MSNWVKIKTATKELNISEFFIRTIICREEFKDFVLFEKPMLINLNDEFKQLIQKFVKKTNVKIDSKKSDMKNENFSTLEHFVMVPHQVHRWTPAAIDCYKIGCDCSKCLIKELLTVKCRMKYSVLKLVKNFGAPNIEDKNE